MENYSLLMGAAAVMKMAVEMAAVSMEKPSGALPRSGVPNETPVPGSWPRWRLEDEDQQRETPHIAVADPYYMRDSQLQDGSRTWTKVVQYLQSFMLGNKEKNTILLSSRVIFRLVEYDDEERLQHNKGVLDEVILGYTKNGGTFDKKGEFIRPNTGKLGFKNMIDFPCIKQLADSMKEVFYVLHHLKGFVEDAEMMCLPPKMMYYVVFEGRVTGVYEECEDYKKQVHKFSGNCYKGYTTRDEAFAKWRKHRSNRRYSISS
ncbi:hypothetical protein QYE76_060539 [Lolium multiflorum]|uniref:Ribonuclease H1 N-terminal domain-containing protein n=1 Tax=Lolium multiflorum TaxID=4521 RepID=A0AAD8RZA2_LOLMU|nr:hypothetical protein QYE76_060539 [Lolium multiflorum]